MSSRQGYVNFVHSITSQHEDKKRDLGFFHPSIHPSINVVAADKQCCRNTQIRLTRTSRRVSRLASLANSFGVFFGANGLYALIESMLCDVVIIQRYRLYLPEISSGFLVFEDELCELTRRLLVLVVN